LIINIDELEVTPDKKLEFVINEHIKELQNESLVVGNITVKATCYGVNVTGHVETDIKLECDRCLKEYTYHIEADIDENFVKGKIFDQSKAEIEIKGENFVEELGDKKEIDLTDLIYQTIILNTPNQKLCDINCAGSEEYRKYIENKPVDPRLQIFKDISDKIK